jgi:hypothetical protein
MIDNIYPGQKFELNTGLIDSYTGQVMIDGLAGLKVEDIIEGWILNKRLDVA